MKTLFSQVSRPTSLSIWLLLLSLWFPVSNQLHAAELEASDGTANSRFGFAVDLSGNIALFGATEQNLSSPGSAYLFRNLDTATGIVTQNVKLTASDRASDDLFGSSVSLSGPLGLIGAYGDNGMTGSAYIFRDLNTATGTVTENAKLQASDGATNDYFGWNLSLSGTTGLIGAYSNGAGGAAYLFRNLDTATETVNQTAKLTSSDVGPSNFFGYAVSLSGSTGVVGAYSNGPGAAYVYRGLDTAMGSVTENVKLVASDGSSSDSFGIAVSLSGSTALIGARSDDSNIGSAYLYRGLDTATGTITQNAKLIASDRALQDNFGNALSLSGSSALIGARRDDSNRGSAYLFLNLGAASGTISESLKLISSDGVAGDFFGDAVSLDGDLFVIGAWGVNSSEGKAYSGRVSTFTTLDSGSTNRLTEGLSFISQDDWIIGESTDSNSLTLSAGDSATVNASGKGVFVGRSAGSIDNVLTIDGTLTAAAVTVGRAGGGSLILNSGGSVTVNSGSGVVKLGELAGASGMLNIGNGGSAGILNAAEVQGGAGSSELIFDHTDANYYFTKDKTSAGADILISGSAKVTHTGSGTTTLSGANTYTGGTFLDAGILAVGQDSNLGAASGTLTFNGGTLQTAGTVTMNRSTTLNAAVGTFEISAGSLAQAGAISGAGTLTKTGPGALILSGTNSYAATNVQSGTLSVGSNAALGSGAVTMSSGTTFGYTAGSDKIISNPFTISGAVTFQGEGLNFLLLNGPITTIGPSIAISVDSGGAYLWGAISGDPGYDLTFSGVNPSGANVAALGGSQSNTHDMTTVGSLIAVYLEKTGGAIAIPGNLQVDAQGGVGVINNNNQQFSSTSTVTLDDGSNLQLGSSNQTIHNLQGSGAVGVSDYGSGGSILTVESGTFSGAIAETGTLPSQLRKTTAAQFSYSGTADYTGATSVEAGTLLLNGTLGNTAVTVSSGATLMGTGSVGGVVTISDGGILAPGTSPGTFTTGGLSLSNASILNYELDTPGVVGGGVNDLTIVNGALTLDGILNITDLGNFGIGTYRLMNYSGALTNNGLIFGTISDFDLALDFSTDDQVNLVVSALTLQYWDGAEMSANGSVDGGTGVWNSTNNNWTNEAGSANSSWKEKAAVFAGTAGTVSLAEDLDFTGLHFSTTGYLIQSTGGSLNAASTAEIEVDATLSAEISAELTGTGGITKTGTGQLLLSGDNTYTGDTTVSEGALLISGSIDPMGTVILQDGAVFGTLAGDSLVLNNPVTIDGNASFTAQSGGTMDILGDVALGSSDRQITLLGDSDVCIMGAISGSAGLSIVAGTPASSPILEMCGDSNSYTGLTHIGNGATLYLTKNLDQVAILGDIQIDNGGLLLVEELGSTTTQISPTSDLTIAGELLFDGFSPISQTLDSISGGGFISNGLFGNEALTLTVNGGNFSGIIRESAGADPITLIKTTSANLTLSGANTYTGTTTVDDGLLVAAASGAFSTGTVVIDGGAVTVNGGVTLSNLFAVEAGGGTLGNNGTLTASLTTDASSGGLTFANAGTVAGNVTLASAAPDRVTLFTGGQITGALAINTPGSSLTLDGSGTQTLSSAAAGGISFSGVTTKSGSGTWIIDQNEALSGGILISAGRLQIGNGGTVGSVAGNIVNNSQLAFNRADRLVYSSAVSGTGAIVQTGTGTLVLTGSNSNRGGLHVENGTAQLGNGGTTGSLIGNVYVKAGATFAIDRSDKLTFSQRISGAGSFTKLGGNTLTLTGANSYSGGTQIAAGTLRATTRTLPAHAVTNNGTLELVQRFKGTFAGDISGKGVLLKRGNGEVKLTGDNTYKGNTLIKQGSLTVDTDSLPDATDVENKGLLIFDQKFTGKYKGNIRNGDLTKDGRGKVTLTGRATGLDDVLVERGILSINGLLRADDIAIGKQGTLSGTGQIVGDITNHGTFHAGNSPGQITVNGDLNLASDGTLQVEIASKRNFDQVTVKGTAKLDGALLITPFGGFMPKEGEKYTFLEARRIRGSFDDIQLPASLDASLIYNRTSLVLSIGTEREPYQTFAHTQNQHNSAVALETLRRSDLDRGTDFDRNVRPVLDLLPAAELRYAFDAVTPTQSISFSQTAFARSKSFLPQMAVRLADVRSRFGSANFVEYGAADMKQVIARQENLWSAWTDASGIFNQSASFENLGSGSATSATATVGADYRVSDNFAIGLYSGYVGSWSEYGSGNEVDSNGTRFGLYSTWKSGGFYLNHVIGGEWNSYDWQRRVAFPGIDRTARADTDGTTFETMFGSGYDWKFGNFTAGVFGGVEYTLLSINSFTEQGAKSLDLRIKNQDADSLRTNLGAQFAYAMPIGALTLRPSLRAAWRHEYLDGSRGVNSNLAAGAGPGFTTTLPATNRRDSLLLNAGASLDVTDRVSVYAYYTGDVTGQTGDIHAVNGGLRWEW